MAIDGKALKKIALSKKPLQPVKRRGRPRRMIDPRKVRLISNALSERLSEAVVAAWFHVAIDQLRGQSRCARPIAQARQAGMYLVHVVFSANLTRAGRVFGRDRTTARYACAMVEEWRDSPSFDAALDYLEPSLRLWTTSFARAALENGGPSE